MREQKRVTRPLGGQPARAIVVKLRNCTYTLYLQDTLTDDEANYFNTRQIDETKLASMTPDLHDLRSNWIGGPGRYLNIIERGILPLILTEAGEHEAEWILDRLADCGRRFANDVAMTLMQTKRFPEVKSVPYPQIGTYKSWVR